MDPDELEDALIALERLRAGGERIPLEILEQELDQECDDAAKGNGHPR